MRVRPEVVEILVCPQTKRPLRLATKEEIDLVNQLIVTGAAQSRSESTLKETIEAGLVRDDGALLYPIVGGVPWLLIEEAIPLQQ